MNINEINKITTFNEKSNDTNYYQIQRRRPNLLAISFKHALVNLHWS